MVLESLRWLHDGSELESFDTVPQEDFHLHERFELVMPRGAPVGIETPTAEQWIPGDQALLIGPGVVHRIKTIGDERPRLERSYIQPWTAADFVPTPTLLDARRYPQPVTREVALSWLDRLHVVGSRWSDPSTWGPAVRVGHRGLARAILHLERNLHRTVPLDELSKACGLSKFHLCRVFHRSVGVTPRTYHRHIRLERGRAQLHEGRPAAVVAYDLSFSDQSHFIRSFRRQFGTTPGEFLQGRSGQRPSLAAAVNG